MPHSQEAKETGQAVATLQDQQGYLVEISNLFGEFHFRERVCFEITR